MKMFFINGYKLAVINLQIVEDLQSYSPTQPEDGLQGFWRWFFVGDTTVVSELFDQAGLIVLTDANYPRRPDDFR